MRIVFLSVWERFGDFSYQNNEDISTVYRGRKGVWFYNKVILIGKLEFMEQNNSAWRYRLLMLKTEAFSYLARLIHSFKHRMKTKAQMSCSFDRRKYDRTLRTQTYVICQNWFWKKRKKSLMHPLWCQNPVLISSLRVWK